MGGGGACAAQVGIRVSLRWAYVYCPGGDIQQSPPRVGAGAVWMGGGGACAAQVGDTYIARWGYVHRPGLFSGVLPPKIGDQRSINPSETPGGSMHPW